LDGLIAINPQTGEKIRLDIKTGGMSEREKQELIGSQAMARVRATGEENRRTNLERPTTPISPTQQRAQQQNTISQILTTRPDLAQFLVLDPNTNQLTINPETPPAEAEMLGNLLRPNQPGDIELPASRSGVTPTARTPTSTTPNASDPLGLRR
jgi:hypothetical protein